MTIKDLPVQDALIYFQSLPENQGKNVVFAKLFVIPGGFYDIRIDRTPTTLYEYKVVTDLNDFIKLIAGNLHLDQFQAQVQLGDHSVGQYIFATPEIARFVYNYISERLDRTLTVPQRLLPM